MDGQTRLYVIGDIHGRSDLLDNIVDKIHRDMEEHERKDCLTITLGDYVDRGPDSKGVLDRLVRNPFPTWYVGLKGNHELMFESFMGDPSVGEQWRRFGGLETLHSYGISVTDLMRGKGFESAARALKETVPLEHMEFLSSLKPYASIGYCFLCHAGVRPGVALENQKLEDLLWIRDEFLNSTIDFGKYVIHGHSPREWPEVRPNRVNIDTGAFATDRLTCLVVDGDRGRFLFTR